MKKQIFVFSVLIVSVLGAMAQNTAVEKRGRFGVRAGVNLAKETYEESGISLTLDNQAGFLAGLVYEYPMTDQLYLGTGLLFSQKGGKIDSGGESMKETLNYLDLPVNLIFKADLKGPKLIVEAGPQLSLAVSGKDKYEMGGISESEDIKFGSGEDEMKNLDFGMNLGGGVEFMDLQLKVNYVIGLSDISNFSEGSVKNKVLAFSLSYFF